MYVVSRVCNQEPFRFACVEKSYELRGKPHVRYRVSALAHLWSLRVLWDHEGNVACPAHHLPTQWLSVNVCRCQIVKSNGTVVHLRTGHEVEV
jgi:hypothetical protein